MAIPVITEVQEQIIEMDGVRYHLVDLSGSGLARPPHQPWCIHCDGNDLAPRDDPDRFRIFDEYCHGHQHPLLCKPEQGLVYKRQNK